MEMCYDSALVMPSSYAVMTEDEMTYVDGGSVLGVPTSLAAGVIDALFVGTPLGAAFAPFKFMGREAAKSLLKKYASTIVGKLGMCVRKLGLMAGSFSVNFPASKILGLINPICSYATSIGGIIAVVLDCRDSAGFNHWIGKKLF